MNPFVNLKLHLCYITLRIKTKTISRSVFNVRYVKKHTKRSSVLLLRLVCFFTERTLHNFFKPESNKGEFRLYFELF